MPNDDIEAYANKKLLCYAHYLNNGGCRVYPQYVITEGSIEPINNPARVFPPFGAIFVPTCNGKYHAIVEIQYANDELIKNKHYQDGIYGNTKYDFYLGNTINNKVIIKNYDPENLYYLCINCPYRKNQILTRCDFYYDNHFELIPLYGENLYLKTYDNKIIGPYGYKYEKGKIIFTSKGNKDYFLSVYSARELKLSSLYSIDETQDKTNIINYISIASIRETTPGEEIDLLGNYLRDIINNRACTERIVKTFARLTPKSFATLILGSPETQQARSLITLHTKEAREYEAQITKLEQELSDARSELEKAEAYSNTMINMEKEKAKIEREIQQLSLNKENLLKDVTLLKSEIENTKNSLSELGIQKSVFENLTQNQREHLNKLVSRFVNFPKNRQLAEETSNERRETHNNVNMLPEYIERHCFIQNQRRTLRYCNSLNGVAFNANPPDGCNYNASQTEHSGRCACDIPQWKIEGFLHNFENPHWYIDTFIQNVRQTWQCSVSDLQKYAGPALHGSRYSLYFDYRLGRAYTTPDGGHNLGIPFELVQRIKP